MKTGETGETGGSTLLTAREEARRLEALQRLHIIDTDPEPAFDAITQVAVALFDVPIATITFVDATRQWFKSKRGLDVTETPRAVAFCSYAIKGPDVMVVPDTHLDPRFVDNALVTGEPHLRFYAGAPLQLSSGERVGTIAIMDHVPRELDQTARGHLMRLSRVVVDAVEQRLRLETARRERSSSLQRAADQSTRHRAILDAALDAIVMADVAGNVVELNPAAERIFRISRATAIGQRVSKLIVPPAHRAQHDAAWARHLATGQSSVLGKRLELSAVDATGREFPVELVVVRLPEEPPIFAAFIRDLTEQRQLHSQLLQAQKMDAVGRLAGGIAHDFNNNLSVVLAYADSILTDLDDRSRVEEDVHEITKAVGRAAELTRQLLTFSRQDTGKPIDISVDDLLEGLANMLGRVVGMNLVIAWRLSSSHVIHADRGSIEQAVMNLVINARDAMPEGGKLTIGTADVEENGDVAQGDVGVVRGRYVRIAITDTGVGMTAAVQQRIFDPFYTTKSHGTGLGLAMVFGIVHQCGGTLRVRSAPAAGSTFELYFPARPSVLPVA